MANISVPMWPRGNTERPLFEWARRLAAWASANNFNSVLPTASAYLNMAGKPEPVVFCSVNHVSSKFSLFHFELRDSTGSRVAERRQAYAFIIAGGIPFNGNVDSPANRVGGWATGMIVATYINEASYLVMLRSTGNNLWSLRHSGNQAFQVQAGFPAGVAYKVGSAKFST